MNEHRVPIRLLQLEPLVATAICALMFFAIPLSQGGIGLSWDALNHHIYLGWMADAPRFDRDFLAAGYQSYQYPYLYWPVYKLAAAGAGSLTAGIVLASLQLTVAPGVWLIARRCIEGSGWSEVVMRQLAVVLAFLTAAVLSLLDVTSNDLLASIPLVWSIALALQALAAGEGARVRWIAVSGLLAGIGVAFKLSNGPIAILLPLLWLFAARDLRARIVEAAVGCIALLCGFVLAYGYWGALLWQHFGNPMYPFYDSLFAPVRSALGWGG